MRQAKLFTACAAVSLTLLLTVLSGCGAAAPEATPTQAPEPEAIESLAIVVSDESIAQLEDYPDLKTLDLSGSACYAAIADYIASHPDVDVTYTVELGGFSVDSGAGGLVLADGDYDYGKLIAGLPYLPDIVSISLPKTTLSAGELAGLREACPDAVLEYSVMLLDQELQSDARSLDLSALEPSQLPEAEAALQRLPELAAVELMSADGQSALALEDVAALRVAAPQAVIHYVFDLFGQTVSTTDERVEFDGVHIGDEGLPRVRLALDAMCCCTYFKLADCGVDSETLAQLRDDYPDTKIVWRVRFGDYFSCLTDEETIRAIFDLKNKNCSELKYCTDVKYMDIGHNDTLTDISFIAYMPKLEICIISGSAFSDMTPFANCPELMFLELVWCGNVDDLSSLKNCTKLEYLNICYSNVTDLTPLYELPLQRFCYYSPKVTAEQQQEFIDAVPDCWTNFSGLNPYVLGWRYDDQGFTFCDMYLKVREVFRYSENFYNHS